MIVVSQAYVTSVAQENMFLDIFEKYSDSL